MVTKISIVGVDDSVCPQDLADISARYPFVEWGVNLCPEPEQKPRYPSAEWIEELLQYANHLRLRGILHGRWESDIIEGHPSLHEERPDIWREFRWMQVDIRKELKEIIKSLQLYPDKIVVKVSSTPMFKANILLPRNCIFTCFEYCGYSVLDTDADWLCKFMRTPYWVSVEGFRSEDNITMDLTKVCEFLDKVEAFVTLNGKW